jgi:6-phosphofructokinase 1
MNAAIRAVVLASARRGWETVGFFFGYDGLIDAHLTALSPEAVHGIARHGGTILGSARSERFMEAAGRQKAAETCRLHGVEALVVIGGDGSYRGAAAFQAETGLPCIGLPGTIDNDLYGTDLTIGFQTAIQTAVEAVDKIMDTAESHGRVFVVEVMGRDAGHIAAQVAAAAGAHAVFIPEKQGQMEAFASFLSRHKNHLWRKPIIIIFAEGEVEIEREALMSTIKKQAPVLDVRSVVLGHLQRGGSPVAADRILATRLGAEAMTTLQKGRTGVALGVQNSHITALPLSQCTKGNRPPSEELLMLVELGTEELKTSD